MGWKKTIGAIRYPLMVKKRKAKVIEVFPEENAVQKILYLVSVEMNEKYSKKTLKYWELVKDTLIKMRKERYGRK